MKVQVNEKMYFNKHFFIQLLDLWVTKWIQWELSKLTTTTRGALFAARHGTSNLPTWSAAHMGSKEQEVRQAISGLIRRRTRHGKVRYFVQVKRKASRTV